MEVKPIIAENFTKAFNILGKPLATEDDFEAYYVERKDSPILELAERIRMDYSPSKILFTGLRACGKTTELRRLMYLLKDEYFIVYFSAMNELELVDLDYKDIILSMILQTIRAAEKESISLDEEISKEIMDLLKRITGEVEVTSEDTSKTGLGFGLSLNVVVAEIMGKYKTEFSTRKVIRENSDFLLQDIIDKFNTLIAYLRGKTSKELIIIMDDLEKADLSKCEEIFYKHSFTLSRPNCKVIFTVPHALFYSPNWRQVQANFPDEYFLPVTSVKKKDNMSNDEGIKLFINIVEKRVKLTLFEEGVLVKIALCSGGVVVDYLRMLRECCIKAQTRTHEKISLDIVHESFGKLVDVYSRIIEGKYYDLLSDVYRKKDAEVDANLGFLLHMNAILEYNHRKWYDIHPAVYRLLIEKGIDIEKSVDNE